LCALRDCLVDQGGRTIEVIFQSDPNRKLNRCSFHHLGLAWLLMLVTAKMRKD
jgi:hypothetical protein